MLRLTGERADGWLPSLSYLSGAGDLDAGNARIDDAARAAGREPTAVRRLLNVGGRLGSRRGDELLTGPPEQWVEQLTALALDHGTSAFIVTGDDPTLLTVVGQEIAPAVREAVAAERAARGTVLVDLTARTGE